MRVLLIAICLLSLDDALADTRLVFLPGVLYFDYVETTADGTFLDGETGPVPGLSAQLEYQDPSQVTAILHGGIYSGRVDYDGHASPSGTPVQTETKANFFNLGAFALFPLEGSSAKTNFVIGYQVRRWERDIQPTVSPLIGNVAGLFELYEWEEFSLGTEIHLDEQFSQQWSFYVGIFQTWNPRITINLEPSGDGKPKLYMGSDTGFEASAQWMIKAQGQWYTGWKMTFKHWQFGQSNTAQISGGRTIIEPNSETKLLMLELVIASKH